MGSLREELEEARELLLGMVIQNCSIGEGKLDSMCLYQDEMRYLAKIGLIEIDEEVGRRVLGHIKKQEAKSGISEEEVAEYLAEGDRLAQALGHYDGKAVDSSVCHRPGDTEGHTHCDHSVAKWNDSGGWHERYICCWCGRIYEFLSPEGINTYAPKPHGPYWQMTAQL